MRSISIVEWVTAVSLIMAVATPLPCLAQRGNFGQSPPQPRRQLYPYQNRGPAPRGPQGHAGDWLRRYKDLPPTEQQRALQNDPQFRRLPPGRQQELQRQLQHFSSLPPQQQQRVLNRMETWEHLPRSRSSRRVRSLGRCNSSHQTGGAWWEQPSATCGPCRLSSANRSLVLPASGACFHLRRGT